MLSRLMPTMPRNDEWYEAFEDGWHDTIDVERVVSEPTYRDGALTGAMEREVEDRGEQHLGHEEWCKRKE